MVPFAARVALCGRRGITLVEILVVVAIIVILMAITGAALQKTAESSRNRVSKEQCYKLQQSLDIEYERIVKGCAKDQQSRTIDQSIVDFCEGDMNRALSVWTAMKLRQQFPENFAEALSPAYITQTAGGLALRIDGVPSGETQLFQLKPLATFTDVVGLSGGQPHEQSGALLYIILTRKSVGGAGAMDAAGDDLSQQIAVPFATSSGGTKELKAFKDGWKKPVGFRRWYGANAGEDEVQNSPYIGSGSPANAANRDPLDPRNLVLGWNDPNKPGQLLAAELFFNNGRNRLATVYSVGKIDTDPSDDLMGFRLRQFGTTGGAQQLP